MSYSFPVYFKESAVDRIAVPHDIIKQSFPGQYQYSPHQVQQNPVALPYFSNVIFGNGIIESQPKPASDSQMRGNHERGGYKTSNVVWCSSLCLNVRISFIRRIVFPLLPD